MYANLLNFEWQFIYKKKSLYAVLLFFMSLGLVLGMVANFPFPNTYYNGSYTLNYIIGISSLLCIFSATLLAAQTLFRERDSRFDSILFATPLKKMPYVASRFTIVFAVNAAGCFFFISGLFAGQLVRSSGNELFGPFRLLNYLQPYVVFLLPNILFCTAVACCIGLLSKNKMLVYVSGVFIYFMYWGVSFYTNSPLIANSTPVSAESMRVAAILDPFGLASFLEQSYYWSPAQRNSQLLQLKGNYLINRLLYLGVSVIMFAIAYLRFSFVVKKEKTKKIKTTPNELTAEPYATTNTTTTGVLYDIGTLMSFLRIELKNIFRSIPVWLVAAGWVGFFMIEAFSDIEGNSRIPEKLATTGVILENIVNGLPLISFMILLFFGNEILWRSPTSRFDQLENAGPVAPAIVLLSQWLSVALVGIFLIVVSVMAGVLIQSIKGTAAIEWQLYMSLFYLIGLPVFLNAGLIVCIQAVFKNRWVGITVAGIVVFLSHTSAGKILRLDHPLLRFANTYQGDYSAMNGFGNEFGAFEFYMMFWFGIVVIIFLFSSRLKQLRITRQIKLSKPGVVCAAVALMLCTALGIYIFRETDIDSRKETYDRMERYERQYGFLQSVPQFTITAVRAAVDLYPSENSYRVNGSYQLVNNSTLYLDSIYVHANRSMQWKTINVSDGKLIKSDEEHGVFSFKCKKPIAPNDSVQINFEFLYTGSAFNKAAGFNTIVNNGSFIRISRFFPSLGFNVDDQLDDPSERRKRNLPPVPVKKLEAVRMESKDFVQLDMTISTDEDQFPVGVGHLSGRWKKDGRSYAIYKTIDPVPFRFAVSSANYALQKEKQGNVDIEVYYSPSHSRNVGHLMSVAKKSLDYFTKNFGAYPFSQLRLVEISSHTKGFAGTAYPGSLFINENFGYQLLLESDPGRDILSEMVSHEISHSWWGSAAIAPDEREGSSLLTETLAMYSEMVIFLKMYGEDAVREKVQVHKNIYLSSRAGSVEEPLYRVSSGKTHLSYNKGFVIMYQLYKLLGEEKINRALKEFYAKYGHSGAAPISTDLLNELYHVATAEEVVKIDEWFKSIVTYDVSWERAVCKNADTGKFRSDLAGTVHRFDEDGKGNASPALYTGKMDIALVFNDDKRKYISVMVNDGKFSTVTESSEIPTNVVADPDLLLLTRDDEAKTAQVKIR